MGFPYTFPFDLLYRGRSEINLDAYIKAVDSVSISLDMWIGEPPGPHWAYMLEIRDRDESLLAILQDAFNINYQLDTNGTPVLDFNLPADCGKTAYLDRDREIWLRNMRTKSVIAKFLPAVQRERR